MDLGIYGIELPKTKSVSKDYTPKLGEIIVLKFRYPNYYRLPDFIEVPYVLNMIKATFELNQHWDLTYCRVEAVGFDMNIEIQAEATNIEPITLAISIVVLALGLSVVYVLLDSYTTLKQAPGGGGMGFFAILIFILLILGVGFTGPKGAKVGK